MRRGKLTWLIPAGAALVMAASCGRPAHPDWVREQFTAGREALTAGDLEAASAVADALEADDPRQPLVSYFRGMVTYRRDGIAAADVLFGDFYQRAYARYVNGYGELPLEERGLCLTAREAAADVAYVYMGEGHYSSYDLFKYLVDDIDAVRNWSAPSDR